MFEYYYSSLFIYFLVCISPRFCDFNEYSNFFDIIGQGMSEGKKALYHCNYCNKDISGKIRIKCACCSDFDLCVECFSVGAEVYPHKNNHPYRVMVSKFINFLCNLVHNTFSFKSVAQRVPAILFFN